MKISEYKGYEIVFQETNGQFSIRGVQGWFDKYKDATAKIDRVIKAETNENYPMDVVKTTMQVGKITSYNKVTGEAQFSPSSGSRTKDRVIDYSGKPRFYKANEGNLALAKRHQKISEVINKLSVEQRRLEKALTEPIIFEAED